MKKASAQDVLDLSVATIELYFRLEAVTQAIAGFAQAGGEWGVLRTLFSDGPQTVPDIARSRPVSRQHCQTIANALERQGFVAFVENPRHKRSHLVAITKKGKARFEAMSRQFLTAAGAYTQHFNAGDVATAIAVLKRAREVIKV